MIENYPDWTSLPGLILDGGYELKDILEADRERAVIRVRVLGDYVMKAFANFYLADPVAAKKQAQVWESLRGFERKINVSTPLGAGTLVVNNSSTVYLVLQNPDERLEEILQQRALRPEEAAEAVRCIARALEELHSHGLVHGCVSPSEVLAFGTYIKLSTQSVREVNGEPIIDSRTAKYLAPESGTRNLTIASDTWCVGASLYEMLTQKEYQPSVYEEAIALNHPFGTIAERCLESDPDERCKIAELEPILRSKAPAAKQKQSSTSPALMASQSTKAAPVGALLNQESPALNSELASVNAQTQSPAIEPHSAPAESQGTKEPPKIDGLTGPAISTEEMSDTSSGRAATRLASSPVSNGGREEGRRFEERSSPFAGGRGLLYAAGAFVLIFLTLWIIRARSVAKVSATSAAQNKGPDTTTEASSQPKPAWPTKTLSPDAKESKVSTPSICASGTSARSSGGRQDDLASDTVHL